MVVVGLSDKLIYKELHFKRKEINLPHYFIILQVIKLALSINGVQSSKVISFNLDQIYIALANINNSLASIFPSLFSPFIKVILKYTT